MGREQLFLQAADGQHLTAQGDLARHGYVRDDGDVRQHADERGTHAHAGAWAVLRRRALRHMDVDVAALVEVLGDAEGRGAAAHEGERRLDRLLHHVAERAGLDLPPLARHGERFDVQQLAAGGRPGETGDDADLVALLGAAIVELAHPVVRFHVICGNRPASPR